MEDVIDVMEDLITKITETETRRNQSPSTVPKSDDVTNVNPVTSKSGNMEIIVLDESLPKAFEYQNEINVQVDPLSTDIENVVSKKEPVTEMVVCKEVIRTLDAEDNLDDIDLAMEVVEEIVVEEVIVDDELDPTSSGEHKANGCEEQVTKFKTLQASTNIMDDERVKVQADASKCPQLIDCKVEGSGDNGNGEDGDDECEDDDDDDDDNDDEYDGDDDDEEEEGKDVKKDLTGGNGVTTDNKPPTLTEQQPEAEDLENIIPEVSINRRSSQESTTTTTTTTTTETSTANSSSSTSDSEGDSSTSNEDSSNSSSNSDSDNGSESNSEEAEPTTATPSVASSALTEKKTRQIPVTAKGAGAKKRDSARNDGQGPNHGMYVI